MAQRGSETSRAKRDSRASSNANSRGTASSTASSRASSSATGTTSQNYDYAQNKTTYTPYSYTQSEFFIIEKTQKKYLTLTLIKDEGIVSLEPYNESDPRGQKWILNDMTDYKNNVEFREIAPIDFPNFRMCLDEKNENLIFRGEKTKDASRYWKFVRTDYFVTDDDPKQVYGQTVKITNYREPKINLATLLDSKADLELLIQTKAPIQPVLTLTKPIVSSDFDGVMHISVKSDPDFYTSLDRATYHPINFYTSELLPNEDILLQLVKDYEAGNQIIIVTARDSSNDKIIREFLKKFKVDSIISNIFYMSEKTSFLKKIGAIKHYEDSPKHIIPMRKAGINVIRVDPPFNDYWLGKKDTC